LQLPSLKKGKERYIVQKGTTGEEGEKGKVEIQISGKRRRREKKTQKSGGEKKVERP